MATITFQPKAQPKAPPLKLSDVVTKDATGSPCITSETLDNIWPRDDRQPLFIVDKPVALPPTCTSQFVPCSERFGHEACIKFVFGGPDTMPETTAVPLGASGPMLLAALGLVSACRLLKPRQMEN